MDGMNFLSDIWVGAAIKMYSPALNVVIREAQNWPHHQQYIAGRSGFHYYQIY